MQNLLYSLYYEKYVYGKLKVTDFKYDHNDGVVLEIYLDNKFQ